MEMSCVSAPDIISSMPLNIIESILMHLPIRDAVRTTILSRDWSYKWVTIPQLIFDEQCILTSSNDEALMKNKLVSFVDRVLLLHKGPIRKFKLSMPYLQSCPNINQWIIILVRYSIEEFILEAGDEALIKMPSHLFYCEKLTHLELQRCILEPPRTFKGFSSLKSLNLQQFVMKRKGIESLISSCSLLERLTLRFFKCSILRICAPRLKYLHLDGGFIDICLENTPFLATVSIHLHINEEIEEHLQQSRTHNLIKVLGHLPSLERLIASADFVKCLSVGNVAGKLPTTYNHLKNLELFQIGFKDVNVISDALCLIMTSPNLQHLQISTYSGIEAATNVPDLDFWERLHPSDCSFKQLKSVTMTDFSGVPHELEFIKFVLAKSPMLETMSIKPGIYVIERGWDMLIELLRFRRASTQAEIKYIKD